MGKICLMSFRGGHMPVRVVQAKLREADGELSITKILQLSFLLSSTKQQWNCHAGTVQPLGSALSRAQPEQVSSMPKKNPTGNILTAPDWSFSDIFDPWEAGPIFKSIMLNPGKVLQVRILHYLPFSTLHQGWTYPFALDGCHQPSTMSPNHPLHPTAKEIPSKRTAPFTNPHSGSPHMPTSPPLPRKVWQLISRQSRQIRVRPAFSLDFPLNPYLWPFPPPTKKKSIGTDFTATKAMFLQFPLTLP